MCNPFGDFSLQNDILSFNYIQYLSNDWAEIQDNYYYSLSSLKLTMSSN